MSFDPDVDTGAPGAADFYYGEYDDVDQDAGDDTLAFDCPAFKVGDTWYCPMQGSEECDWDCPGPGQ